MKTIRITLTKPGAQAVCTHRYRLTEWPAESTWAGNRSAFPLNDGSLPCLLASYHRLEATVAHQAAQSGAAFTIEDLGGEAVMWTDEIIPPAAEAGTP
ncbi:MAG: hypothetical protein NTW21_08580 [Verrucomicrobia bacterium]|nr:hypothetical protein [Verrucomicrobiota bacterium]